MPAGWRGAPVEAPAEQVDTTTTGEPYELAGRRIVFTSWQFIRPGTFHYVDAAGQVLDLEASARPDGATMRRVDMPHGIKLVAQPAERLGPILDRTVPWEAVGVNFWSLFFDEGRFRAWGSCSPTSGDLRFCYFESSDGLTWTRPELGLSEFGGSTRTNLLPIPVGSVFKDPAAPPAERYKWVSLQGIGPAELEQFRARRPDAWEPRAVRDDAGYATAIRGAHSPDGLHWEMLPDPLVVEHSDTQLVAYYDTRTRTYVLYTRHWMIGETSARASSSSWQAVGRRSIGLSESADFRRFPLSRVIVDPPLTAMPTDVLYSNARTSIPGAPDHHLMFPSIWHTADDRMSIAMASSYNGRVWNWLSGSPVLPPNTPGQWDGGYVFGHPDLIELPDGRFALPYTGYRLPHKFPRGEWEFSPGYAVWPHGRIVAVEAPEQGELTTVGFYPPARRLRLNVRTRESGSVRVEVAGLNGRTVQGRGFSNMEPIVGDHPAVRVRWEGRDDLGVPRDQPIILRFRLQSAELFAVDFAD